MVPPTGRSSCMALVAAVLIASGGVARADAVGDANAAHAACRIGQFVNCIDLASRAIATGRLDEQTLAVALTTRCWGYVDYGQPDRGITDCDMAISLAPDDPAAHYNRGNAYFNKSDYRRAIVDYDRAIRHQEDFAFAYGNRGLAYEFLNDYAAAIWNYRKALSYNANVPVATEGLRRLNAN